MQNLSIPFKIKLKGKLLNNNKQSTVRMYMLLAPKPALFLSFCLE